MGYYYLAEFFYEKRRRLDDKDRKFIRAYHNMMQRCYDKNSNSYKNYGGRSIAVCWRWHDFENFYKDMYATFSVGLSLDRINNDFDYSPRNCKWSTKKEQALNRRSNRMLDLNGFVMTLEEWATKLGIKRSTLEMRLDKYGWSVEKALTTPVKKGGYSYGL